MIGIVERLRFDATRCELQFSKGVAGNISEGADKIERLCEVLKFARKRIEYYGTISDRRHFDHDLAETFPKIDAALARPTPSETACDQMRGALGACREFLVGMTKPTVAGTHNISSYHPCQALIDRIDAALATPPTGTYPVKDKS